jgi:hypothetical protein
VSRRYLPATNVLETRYVTPTGVLTVVDCLAIRRGAAAGDAARTRSHHQLLRLVRCEAGQVEVTVEFAPRFDYGLTIPRLELHGDDLGVVYGGADALVLQSELTLVQTEVCGCGATATLRAGDQTFLALTHQLPTRSRSTGSAATRSWPASTARSASGGTGRPGAPTMGRTGSRCCAAPWSSKGSPTPPPAPSSPPPPPPCPSSWVGCATGTTATAGCGMPP